MSTSLDGRLSLEHRALLERVPDAAARASVRVYLVGGAVRDLLLEVTPRELDLAISGEGENPIGSLVGALEGRATMESQFGTARVEADGVGFDVARARRETYARPGALPSVTFADSIGEDLTRRDFTIHAMAVSLNSGSFGELLDPLGGQRDLEAGQVRVLQARSFEDDPTRILRAVRYTGRLELAIEQETAGLLAEGLRWLDSVSGDRIVGELGRTAAEERLGVILGLAERLGVLRAIHPALSAPDGLADGLPGDSPPSLPGLLAALSSSAGDPERDGLVARLGLSAGNARAARDVGKIRSRIAALRGESLKSSEVYGLLQDVDAGAVEGWMLAHSDSVVRRRFADYLARMRVTRPMLDGRRVIALGVEEGPPVGEMLRALLMARLDGEVETREDEERFVRRRLESRPRLPRVC